MKTLWGLVCILTLFGGCSDQKTEGDKSDHMLRQEIDVMHDAQSVTQTMNAKTKEQEQQADALAGH
ncbi:hypothetical protein LOH54_09205 [Sulfurimonas sp. HSL-3221]|uniref:hypothetical protein n=1 Tax=Sulfurimonadaceae TaxID=2771471 RepID=UPI001E54C1A9|nr:hypothetical protein [Sulfurimonas sp. HSL-3221]UFS61832.1 hypothetical protein LOH54_09205 [Sulfurimonas sp. HSL-3221]